jgi:hypothetical protein
MSAWRGAGSAQARGTAQAWTAPQARGTAQAADGTAQALSAYSQSLSR